MFSIVVSKEDKAGMNFKQQFIEKFGFKETAREFDGNRILQHGEFELLTLDKFQIYSDHLDKHPADFFIFASRHASAVGLPSLTVHPIGNFGKAEFGGKDNSLVPSSGFLARNYLLALKEKNIPGFDVSLEATHHGPFLSKPAIFIELGSSAKQWPLEKPAEAICETILQKTSLQAGAVACIGLGGGHYCPYFTRKVLEENFAFSHIAAKYAVPFLTQELLQQMIEKSIEKPQKILVDKKGLGRAEQRNRIKELLEKIEIEKVFF